MGFFRLLCLCYSSLLLAFGLGDALASAPGTVAVIYPDVGEPYRAVFLKILDGIDTRLRNRMVAIPVGARFNAHDIAEDLRRQDVRVVIALGRQGIAAAAGLDLKLPVVAGAVLSAQDGDARLAVVHSLSPDPSLLLARAKNLLPELKRVFVVHDPGANAWQIRLAREAARNQALDLAVTEVGDLKAAARAYRSIFEMADPRRDAIWLLQDPLGAEESTIVPFVLEEAWTRSLPVFSSNLAHVRRGALFTLYPDNEELGRRLGSTALGVLAGSGPSGVAPLREVLFAVNQRSAQHLGISLNVRQQGIDLILPAQ